MAKPIKRTSKSGRPFYVARVPVQPTRNHPTPYKEKSFARRKDAQAYLDAWHAAHDRGDIVDVRAGEARIGELYETWIAGKSTRKPKYVSDLESAWHTHVEPVFAQWRINELRHSDVQRFVSELAQVRSASITNRCLDILRGICKTAILDGRIGRNPCDGIEKPRPTKRKADRHYLTVRQLYSLADSAGRWKPLVLTLGLTGIRAGEARALRVRDVDFGKHRLRISLSTTRNKGEWVTSDTKTHAARDVPIPACVEKVLWPLCDGRAGDCLVFTRSDGKPFDEQSVGRHVKNVGGKYWLWAALQGAGLPDMTMHDLRHTAASIAVSAGANVLLVQRMLGHEDASVTLKTYADLFDSDMDIVRDTIDQIVRRDIG